MINYTLQSFPNWNLVEDYESTFDIVTLLDSNKNELGTFNYPTFTREDFDYFKTL